MSNPVAPAGRRWPLTSWAAAGVGSRFGRGCYPSPRRDAAGLGKGARVVRRALGLRCRLAAGARWGLRPSRKNLGRADAGEGETRVSPVRVGGSGLCGRPDGDWLQNARGRAEPRRPVGSGQRGKIKTLSVAVRTEALEAARSLIRCRVCRLLGVGLGGGGGGEGRAAGARPWELQCWGRPQECSWPAWPLPCWWWRLFVGT